MTKQDFIDRTGFTPTDENFAIIEKRFFADAISQDANPDDYVDSWCDGWVLAALEGPVISQEKMCAEREAALAFAKRTGAREQDYITCLKDAEIARLSTEIERLEDFAFWAASRADKVNKE